MAEDYFQKTYINTSENVSADDDSYDRNRHVVLDCRPDWFVRFASRIQQFWPSGSYSLDNQALLLQALDTRSLGITF